MLRDLVAAIVVERARRLTGLTTPRDAFTGRHSWTTGDYTRVVHVWKEELTGFEIVVASANNGAVENVTNEIPGVGAIDASWGADVDYFDEIATALLNVDNLDDDPKTWKKAWAMIAARLGNKTNRGRFAKAFWYGDKKTERAGLHAHLKQFEEELPERTWAEAVSSFQEALARAEAVQSRRVQTCQMMTDARNAEQSLNAAHTVVADVAQRLEATQVQRDQVTATAAEWRQAREDRLAKRREHREFQPGFVETLFTFGRALRSWREIDNELLAGVRQAEEAIHGLHTQEQHLSHTLHVVAQEKVRSDAAVQAAESRLNRLRSLRTRRARSSVTTIPASAGGRIGCIVS